jgi:hypothetical protein
MADPYLEYFLTLDSDLATCTRYLDFTTANFGVASTEFARLLIAAGSECDALAKEICKKIKPDASPRNILQYCSIIVEKYPRVIEHDIALPRFKLELMPWREWTVDSSPSWWKDFNGIKHERQARRGAGNLGNALHATAGVLVLLAYYLDADGRGKELFDWSLSPKLFEPRLPPEKRGFDASISWTIPAWKP